MSTEIATLRVDIDATSADAARAKTDAYTEAGKRAEAQTERLSGANKVWQGIAQRNGETLEQVRARYEAFAASQNKYVNAIKDQAKTEEIVASAIKDRAISAQQATLAIITLEAASKSYNAENQRAIEALKKLGGESDGAALSMKSLGLDTKEARQQLMVLGREALSGDFSRMPLTFGSLVSHSNILPALLNPITLAIVGIGVAAGGMAVAILQGRKEMEAINQAIGASGNFAGVTRQSMRDLAESVSAYGGVAIGTSKDIVSALVSSGQIGSGALKEVALAAKGYADVSGQEIAKIGPELVKLFAEPSRGAAELNKTINFLNAAELEHIKHLENIGRTGEAQLVVAEKLNGHLANTPKHLGSIETATKLVMQAFSGMWDAAMGLGRDPTQKMKLLGEQARLTAMEVAASKAGEGSVAGTELQKALETQRAIVLALNAKVNAEERGAAEAAKGVEAQREGLRIAKLMEASSLGRIAALKDEQAAIRGALGNPASGLSDAQQVQGKQRVLELDKQIRDIQHGIGAEARALAQEGIDSRLKMQEIAIRMGIAESESQMKVGQITRAQHDATKTTLELIRNTVQQNAEIEKLAIGSLSELERKKHTDRLDQLQAEAEAIKRGGANQQAEDALKAEADLRARILASTTPMIAALAEMAAVERDYAAAIADQVDKARMEQELIGMSPAQIAKVTAARQIDLAVRKQIEKLTAEEGDFNSAGQSAAIARLLASADAGKKNLAIVIDTTAAMKALHQYLDPTKARDFGAILGDSFGKAGGALGGLLNGLEQYRATMAQIEKEREATKGGDPAKQAELEAMYADRSAKAQVRAYGDMASAAKGFFKEGTTGYKLMEATERAFRAAELAMALENYGIKIAQLLGFTAVKTATTTANIGLEATETAASVAGSGTRTIASTVAGVAKAFEQMGVWGFVGAAAILAFMASLGAGAGGGGGSAPSLSEDRQRTQGTGSILGDKDAKSDSILHALDLLRQNSSDELLYQSGMLTALRSIESNMKGLAALVARNPKLTGADTEGLNLGGRMTLGFGSTRSLADAGIVINAQTVQMARSGISASGYADVETQRSSWFGLSRSTSTSRETTNLPTEMLDYLSKTIDAMAKGITAAVKVLLGAKVTTEQITSILNRINIDLTNISLKDLAGADIQDALSAVLSSIGDAMVQGLLSIEGLGALADFQHVGEGAFETIIRVASGVERARGVLNQWGINIIDWQDIVDKQGDVTTELIRDSIVQAETTRTFINKMVVDTVSGVGRIIQGFDGTADELVNLYEKLRDIQTLMRAAGIDANMLSQEMITAAGGLSALQQGLEVYTTRFFSSAEQIAFKTNEISGKFGELGLTMPTTFAGLRTMIEHYQALGDQEMVGHLLALVPAWVGVQDAATDAAKEAHQSWMDIGDLIGQLNGETEAERNARHAGALTTQFQRDNAWAQGLNFDQLIVKFQEMFKDEATWAGLDKGTRDLIRAMLGLAVDMRGVSDAVKNMDPAYRTPAGDFTSRNLSDFERRFGGIIGEQDSAAGSITLEQRLATEQIAANRRRQRELEVQFQGYLLPPEHEGLRVANLLWEERIRNLGIQLGVVTVLTAQYGQEVGDQIYELDNWYKEQQRIVGDNHVALRALEELYAERRREILEEAVREVTEARQELRRWRADLLGEDSPLTNQQRLDAALTRYNAAIAGASAAGAGQDEYSEYQRAAEAYMREGSSFFGRASTEYGLVFARILRESGILSGEIPSGGSAASAAFSFDQTPTIAAMNSMESTYVSEGQATREELASQIASLREEVTTLKEALVDALSQLPQRIYDNLEGAVR